MPSTATQRQWRQPAITGPDQSPSPRVLALDAFRGVTILLMIFVNALAGVRGVPAWLEHAPAGVDGMTVADVVFPAFLFIVGMSIPFALARRRAAGDRSWQLVQHIVTRTFGLLVLGVFMVNAENGFNEAAMGMSIHIWSLMVYGAAILTWGGRALPLRVAGGLALLVLALRYRGGMDGMGHLTPQWWGILGLIGWAYLAGSALYLLGRAKMWALAAGLTACIGFYCASQTVAPGQLTGLAGDAVHTAIVLCGLLTSRILLEGGQRQEMARRRRNALLLATSLLACGAVLRPCFHISKIAATPTWALYSAAICVIGFGCLYWLVDLRGIRRWTTVLQPAAGQPLLAYIVPYIVYALTQYFHLTLPDAFNADAPGMLAAFAYACAVVASIPALNRVGIRLHL